MEHSPKVKVSFSHPTMNRLTHKEYEAN